MQSPLIIVLASLAVLSLLNWRVSQATGLLDGVPTDYLPLGNVARIVPEIGRELLQIIRKNPLPPNVSEMAQTISTKQETAKEFWERDYFQELANLAGPQAECTPNMRRYVLTTLALATTEGWRQEPALKNYVTFVKLFGQTKYGACAQDTEAEFEHAQDQLAHSTEEALDELFMAYLDAPRIMENLQLYQAAKKMDFVSGRYKVRRMLKVAKQFMPNQSERNLRALKSLDLLGLFISNWCDLLQRPLANVFATFNIARAFGAQMTTGVSIRFLKLNEYNRVCLTWQEHREKAVANLERQLKATKWYKLNGLITQHSSCLWRFNCLGGN